MKRANNSVGSFHECLLSSRGLVFLSSVLTLLFFSACAQKPTKVYTSEDINTLVLAKALHQPIQVTEDTVILDARLPFDFAVAHLAQAVNVRWEDFADSQGPYPGRMKADLSAEVRRLALLGIGPNTPVVILGSGVRGKGEEGRLAWTLLYLGVFNVQTAEADSLGLRYSNIVSQPRANVPAWEPHIRDSILSSREEVIHVAISKHDERVHILDVRSKNEYFSKNRQLQYEVPDLRAVHVEWKEFFTPQGRPNEAIKDQLQAINIIPTDRVLVISNNGARSGAVTYALLSMGYKKAANFAGGYTELLKIKQK